MTLTNAQVQGARTSRSEAYFAVRRSDPADGGKAQRRNLVFSNVIKSTEET
jgi:hypothetical protein